LFETGDDVRYGQIRTKKAGDIQQANKIIFLVELNAPRALIGLLRGVNFGKHLVRVATNDTRHHH
jgi:NADPH-dependent curcumin reductase CurA